MAVWLVRAGKHGEHEGKFLTENRVYVTWDGLNLDLGQMTSRDELRDAMTNLYPDVKPKAIQNWASQVFPFAHAMELDDLVILPLKGQPSINVGRITGPYTFAPEGRDPYFHWRNVEWVGDAIPRENFGQDLLFSFGAFMTICRVQRNNAESRIRAMWKNGWAPESVGAITEPNDKVGSDGEQVEGADLEELAEDQIARLISARFKGHNLTRLVDAVLRAEGYTTLVSPAGPDGGADILAGAGPLGFSRPRLCVEVKSESGSIDRPAVDKLLGAVTKYGADEGLFVAWGGFKSTVQKELAPSFFRVRLWSRRELLSRMFQVYDRLDEEIRAELPLKRIWTVASEEAG